MDNNMNIVPILEKPSTVNVKIKRYTVVVIVLITMTNKKAIKFSVSSCENPFDMK